MIIWRNRDQQLVLQSVAICQRQARSDKLNFDRMIDCKIISHITAIISLNFIAKSDVFYDSVMHISKMQVDERAEKELECAMKMCR